MLKLNTRTKKSIIAGSALLAVIALGAPASYAQGTAVQFAEFTSRPGITPIPAYQFTNTGSGSTFTSIQSNVPVRFAFDVANSYGGNIGDFINATLTLTGTATTAATTVGGNITQSLSSFTFTYTANTPVNGKNILLSGTFTANPATGVFIDISGANGASTATLNVSSSNPGGVVAGFESQFLSFTNQTFTTESLAFTLGGLNNTTTPANRFAVAQNGYLENFTSSANGTFTSNPQPTSADVPEPATLGLLATGVLMGGATFRRRLRRIAK